MKNTILLLLFLSINSLLKAQDYRQTVRGRIIDIESQTPIEFAAITLSKGEFQRSAISNEYGEFKIEKVPVGRIKLHSSCMGFQGVELSNLEVTMGKELLVTIEMVESVVKLEEVSIKAFHNKENALNTYAPISARTFSIEESQRYAGSNNDVSMMAMNFAGVSMLSESTNEIIIRGNSPLGVLFRLDGVDIPNPSHFGDGGTTGGPIGMLNNNVLANSDFLTGAFPAEYGNAISGVFDLRIRSGNNEKHEFLAQVGLMGVELGAEGPISRNKKSSYLINYRYSTLSVFRGLGIEIMGTAVVDYQDLTFKLNFPSRKIGTITFFGLGGKSCMRMFDSERDTTEEKLQMAYESDYEIDIINKNYSGAVGLTHSYIFNNSAYSKLILSATTIWNLNQFDSLSTVNRNPVTQYFSDFDRKKYTARFYLNKKFDSRNTIRMGFSSELQRFNLLDSTLIPALGSYRILRDYNGQDLLSQAFVQYRHKMSDKMLFTLGLNSNILASKGKFNIEPRTGLKWEFLSGHSFSLGYGLHSISNPVELVHQKITEENGIATYPNEDLDNTKSHHFIFGYDTRLFNKLRFKSEIYYQYLTNVPVEELPSSYSSLNRGAYSFIDVEALSNVGKGYNYGIEITAEKFMNKGSYFLTTFSLFESKYKGSDGVLRNTAFNTNYVLNLLGGKEFTIGSKNKNSRFIKKLVLDGKINWAGGQRYSPIDLEASRIAGTTVFDNEDAFSMQLQDYFRVDLRIAFKWIGKNSSQEFALDIRNLTNRKNPFHIKFDPETGDLKTLGFGMSPNVLYRIRF